MDNIIEVKNLTKKFGNFIAVNNISFNIKKGEILGFLGPNGAGKTTSIKMINGLLKITSGEILVNGHVSKILSIPFT
jgi:ABC-type multidrug transport system ATPase subunit